MFIYPCLTIRIHPQNRLVYHQPRDYLVAELKQLLPVSTKMLQPETPSDATTKLIPSRDKQTSYYNQVAKALPQIVPEEVIRMKLPGQDYWSKAVCN